MTTTGSKRVCQQCRRKRERNPEARRAVKRRRRARKANVPSERYTSAEIFERDRWRCYLCGKPVHRTKVVPHPKAPVIDHVIPLAKGGDDTRANVQCAHFICNSIKSDGVHGDGEQLRLMG